MPKTNALRVKHASRLQEIVTEVEELQVKMNENEEENTDENRDRFKSLLAEGEEIQTQIKNQEMILGLKSFVEDPINPRGGDGDFSEPFTGAKSNSLGALFVANEGYETIVKAGRIGPGMRVSVEAKGFLNARGQKATFDSSDTGLSTSTNYQGNGGMPVMLEQQRLTVADLFASGQTTLNSVPYIKETSYTNAADTVAEEGLKPEATFATEAATAPVKKIAVTGKVTDEMFADFPMMRDYVNNRLRFMVAEREEAQLLLGDGVGANLTGVLSTSGIQTQAKAADTVPDAIHKAITKVRSVGFFEPDALVIHPNDWQDLRLLKDDNNQYYGGGPFTGPYGNGPIAGPTLWGLRVVVTTAITEGTALVGAFQLGGQVFYREGITIDATNSNEDDFIYNRITIRVEERAALAIYRPLAFCKVTGI